MFLLKHPRGHKNVHTSLTHRTRTFSFVLVWAEELYWWVKPSHWAKRCPLHTSASFTKWFITLSFKKLFCCVLSVIYPTTSIVYTQNNLPIYIYMYIAILYGFFPLQARQRATYYCIVQESMPRTKNMLFWSVRSTALFFSFYSSFYRWLSYLHY